MAALGAAGLAPDAGPAPVRPAAADLGAAASPSGGYVLDAFGALHRFGVVGSGYWPGWDIVRGGGSGSGSSGGHAPPPPPTRRRTPVLRRVTYVIAVLGAVRSNPDEFAGAVSRTLNDERGWAAAGYEFVEVGGGGDMTVWLSQASRVPSFGAPCSSQYSCRQGRNVIINDDRFAFGSAPWPGALEHYRQMVINHEAGHWLGFGHSGCPGPGAPAPVMMQQSISLGRCSTNPWPRLEEIAGARNRISGAAGFPAGSAPGGITE